jgi:hypothetical protein
MKEFKFPLNIYGVAIVVFLFALLRLSHAIMVITQPKPITKATVKANVTVTKFPQTLFPSVRK